MTTSIRTAKRSTPAVLSPGPRTRVVVRAAVLLAMVACALYAPSWRHGFVGDDAFVIGRNAWTQQGLSALRRIVAHSLYFGSVQTNAGLYRPAAGAYYVVVGALAGLRPAGFHLAHIGLYGLNAAIVFVFLTRVTRRSIAVPFAATLLFIAHPIHTEVVNNIKSADEMLCLLFFLSSATAWLMAADASRRSFSSWRSLSLAAYALAVCSKETAVPMVVVLPALWYFFRRRGIRESLVASMPFWGVALLYLVVRQVVFNAEPATNTVTLANNALLASNDGSVQLASALAYVAQYARMLIWPHPLSFDYSYNAIPAHTFADPVAWLAMGLIAALTTVVVKGFKDRRLAAFAVLWCAASLVLVTNLLFLVSTNFGERLLYLPSVVVCYGAARVLFRLAKVSEEQPLRAALQSPIVLATLLIVLSAASTVSVRRTREWRDEITLFSADVLTYPNSARLNNYLGNTYYFAGNRLVEQHAAPDTAATDFANAKRYLLRGLAIHDEFLEQHAVLGMAEYQLREYREAIPHLQRSLTFPDYRVPALEMIAGSYEQLHMPDRALATFKQIDDEGIPYPHGWFALGNDATARGDYDTSIAYFDRVIAATPGNVNAHFNLAVAHYRKGDFVRSLESCERCVAMKADKVNCLALAAEDLARTGHRDRALAYFSKAAAIDPGDPWVRSAAAVVK
jgi:hypothetical protein